MVLEIRPGVVLAVAAIALAPVAVFAPNGTVVILVLAGAILALDGGHRRAALALLGRPIGQLLVAFFALAVLASLWSFDPLRGLLQAIRLALMFAAGFVALGAALALPPAEARAAQRGMAFGGVLLVGLMLIETASGAALTQFFRGVDATTLQHLSDGAPLSRGGIVLAFFLWPIVCVVRPWYGSRALAPLLAGAAVALWLQPTEATVIAGIAGGAVFLAGRFLPAATRRLGGIAVVVLLLAPPLVAATLPVAYDAVELTAMPQSHRHRVQIWTYALDRSLERPLFGWGFDASRELMGIDAKAAFEDAPMSVHPHNATLQVWMELGIGGVAALVAVGCALWRRAARLDPPIMPAALAGFAAWMVFAGISRGVWQTWWLAATWLFAVWLATLARPSAP